MFCPRCGRAVNENANFCGGCGLSRVEIEKFAAAANIKAEAAQEAPKTEVKSEVPFGTVVNETAQTAGAQSEEKSSVEQTKEIIAENTDATENQYTQPAQEQVKTEPAASYTAPEGAEYHYSAADGSYQNATQTGAYSGSQYGSTSQTASYSSYTPPAKNENLSTVDFIWMLLISSIPVVGLIYLIYLAIQDNNTNKRSYARATLIISLFAVVVSFVFIMGFIIAGL